MFNSEWEYNTRGLRTAYVLADPPCVHPKVLTCASPKIVTFRRGDAAPRAVIGPFTKTRHRIVNIHDYVEATAGVLALR